jgi:NhaP-type Na+/H+ or K+/H+ antiporter
MVVKPYTKSKVHPAFHKTSFIIFACGLIGIVIAIVLAVQSQLEPHEGNVGQQALLIDVVLVCVSLVCVAADVVLGYLMHKGKVSHTMGTLIILLNIPIIAFFLFALFPHY